MGLFGIGKKEKPPFKIPREVTALRNSIESESRENFPNLARYQEIAREAELVCRNLDAVIAQKEYAEEAARLRDDIKSRIARLADKISRNRKGAAKEDKEDYVERNIDYLRRKSVRNNAKTLFTEFLEQLESIKKCCRGERVDHDRTMDSIAMDLIKTVSALNSNFFRQHGADREIVGLKNEVLSKLAGLNRFVSENKARIAEQGLETKAASNMMKLLALVKDISA
jgi:hypothetical protein